MFDTKLLWITPHEKCCIITVLVHLPYWQDFQQLILQILGIWVRGHHQIMVVILLHLRGTFFSFFFWWRHAENCQQSEKLINKGFQWGLYWKKYGEKYFKGAKKWHGTVKSLKKCLPTSCISECMTCHSWGWLKIIWKRSLSLTR